MKRHSSKLKSVLAALFLTALIFAGYTQLGFADQDMPPSGITADTPSLTDSDMAPEVEAGARIKAAENDVYIRTHNGNVYRFDVELALRPDEQERGLMFRNSMPDDHGMLFIFQTIAQRSFWMKNTLIPLDMLFINADGRIDHIHYKAKPQDLTFITSGRPSKAVLELNGGTADALGIEEGDYVFHSAFQNLNLLHQ